MQALRDNSRQQGGQGSYCTLTDHDGGMDYREIAEQMTQEGYACGHSTVRNIILRSMERFACAVMGQYGFLGDPSQVAREPMFQKGVAELLQQAIFSKERQ